VAPLHQQLCLGCGMTLIDSQPPLSLSFSFFFSPKEQEALSLDLKFMPSTFNIFYEDLLQQQPQHPVAVAVAST